jgi:hypothetical protein
MKIPTTADKQADIHIDRVEFGTTWIRIAYLFLVGFSASQLLDFELVASRIAVVTHIELDAPIDTETWWNGVVRQLRADFEEQQRELRVLKPRKKKVKVHAVETDDLDTSKDAA